MEIEPLIISYFVKNTRCATRIHNKVSETFSDRKFYLKHKLSTASLQSSTGKVIINYSTDIATGQWFTITTIMTCNITRISFAYVNSQCNEYTMNINYVYDQFFSNKNLYCSGKCSDNNAQHLPEQYRFLLEKNRS